MSNWDSLPQHLESRIVSEISTKAKIQAWKPKKFKTDTNICVKQEKLNSEPLNDVCVNNTFIYNGEFMGKPRMVKSDKWSHRECVDRYWGIKDEMLRQANGFILGDSFKIEFYIAMPISWSKKKKSENNNKPHNQKPDIDNLLKSVCDILLVDDSKVWHINAYKYWAWENKIVITNKKE